MVNINGLQKICDVLLENPSWSLAHLVAYFNTVEHISNPKIQGIIDTPDYATLMTPIQVNTKIEKLSLRCKMVFIDCFEYFAVGHQDGKFGNGEKIAASMQIDPFR